MALNNRSENRSEETFCAVVNHEELPYVARFTYKWTVALREKSLLRVTTGSGIALREGRLASNFIMHAVHKISKCNIQVVGRRKRPNYLICTCFDPPQWVSITNTQVKEDCFIFEWLWLADHVVVLKHGHWSYDHVSNRNPLPGPHLNDHLMCEQFLFQKSILFQIKPTSFQLLKVQYQPFSCFLSSIPGCSAAAPHNLLFKKNSHISRKQDQPCILWPLAVLEWKQLK